MNEQRARRTVNLSEYREAPRLCRGAPSVGGALPVKSVLPKKSGTCPKVTPGPVLSHKLRPPQKGRTPLG
jgi:hypothetical protein